MNKFKSYSRFLTWFMALLLSALVAGCGGGGGGGGRDPILGGGGGAALAPTVTITSPVNAAAVLTTSRIITATFSEAMNPATLTPASFTLTCAPTAYTGGLGTVVMSAGNTVATLTLPADLPVSTCTATVTAAAQDADNGLSLVAGAVPNPWTFTTAAPAIIPGAVCSVATGATIPTVDASDPTDGNANATISTDGAVPAGAKLITANFSLEMNPTTITSPLGTTGTFTLRNMTDGLDVTATVTMNAAGRVATLTTAAALLPAKLYRATITTAATSASPPAVAATALACPYEWTFTTRTPPPASSQGGINLGTASTYGIFVVANAGLTLTGPSTEINGDIGFMSNGAGSCTVFPFAVNTTCAGNVPPVNGVVHNGDAAAAQAQIDFNAAYVDGAGRVTNKCELANGDLSSAQAACVGFSPSTPGPIYGPGLYHFAPAFGWSSTITLDAQNDPDAVFIFQADNGFTSAAGSTVILANQAQAKNVFWIVGTAATLGVSSIFKGTIIVGGGGAAAVTVNGGTALLPTLVEGRIFSGAAATVGTFATITVPQ